MHWSVSRHRYGSDPTHSHGEGSAGRGQLIGGLRRRAFTVSVNGRWPVSAPQSSLVRVWPGAGVGTCAAPAGVGICGENLRGSDPPPPGRWGKGWSDPPQHGLTPILPGFTIYRDLRFTRIFRDSRTNVYPPKQYAVPPPPGPESHEPASESAKSTTGHAPTARTASAQGPSCGCVGCTPGT